MKTSLVVADLELAAKRKRLSIVAAPIEKPIDEEAERRKKEKQEKMDREKKGKKCITYTC